MPPTEYLVMEVLAARWRLGQNVWTFPTSTLKAIRDLTDQGLVWWKHGTAEHTVLVRLTDAGVKAWKLDKPDPNKVDRPTGTEG